jgi:tRNA-splicing endonuclease subunit Sen15
MVNNSLTGRGQEGKQHVPRTKAMAPSALTMELPIELPPSSALQNTLNSPDAAAEDSQTAHLYHLASIVLHNLQYQHDWVFPSIHTHSTSNELLPRPVVSGLPPRRAYIHPDEQVAILKAEHDTGKAIEQIPEYEWVLPTHWEEKWTLASFAAIFDALDTTPPSGDDSQEQDKDAVGYEWQGKNRQKRLLLATIHDDSTIVYYIMHDGIVKPRQN